MNICTTAGGLSVPEGICTTAGGLSVPEGIIHPVVTVSTLT